MPPQSYKRNISFIELNPEYHKLYYNLLDEAKYWNSCSQYWLGKEATRRAECLLRGDVLEYQKAKYSDQLYYPHCIIHWK